MSTSKSFTLEIKEAFSNKTGQITRHQIIVTQLADVISNVAAINYWGTSDGTKQPYVAIECPQFFNSQCPLQPSQQSHSRRKRSANDEGGFPIVIGADDSCSSGGTRLCNGNLQPSTAYYVLYRACNAAGQCSSAMKSQPEHTSPGTTRTVRCWCDVSSGGSTQG